MTVYHAMPLIFYAPAQEDKFLAKVLTLPNRWHGVHNKDVHQIQIGCKLYILYCRAAASCSQIFCSQRVCTHVTFLKECCSSMEMPAWRGHALIQSKQLLALLWTYSVLHTPLILHPMIIMCLRGCRFGSDNEVEVFHSWLKAQPKSNFFLMG